MIAFETAEGAAADVKSGAEDLPGEGEVKRFDVPGVPGAEGFDVYGQQGLIGRNVAFNVGEYEHIVGVATQQPPTKPQVTREELSAVGEDWYDAVRALDWTVEVRQDAQPRHALADDLRVGVQVAGRVGVGPVDGELGEADLGGAPDAVEVGLDRGQRPQVPEADAAATSARWRGHGRDARTPRRAGPAAGPPRASSRPPTGHATADRRTSTSRRPCAPRGRGRAGRGRPA